MCLGAAEFHTPLGGAVVWDSSIAGTIRFPEGDTSLLALRITRERLQAFSPGVEDRLRDPVLNAPSVVRLLRRYCELVTAPGQIFDPATQFAVSQHIIDLTALAVGTGGDMAYEARRRGWGAARFAEIKADIISHIRHPDLSLDFMIKRHKISERYLQSLFTGSGTTFTDFVLEQRLQLAYRLLTTPEHRHRKISDIAHSAGFSDISYFHRTFRRRFGDTPQGVRESSLRH